MKRYIGLDVHAMSTTMAVVGESGKQLRSVVLDTNAAVLIDAIKGVAGERYVLMEEGTQSAWLHEVLSPHCAEFVVMALGKEAKRLGNKNDTIDAFDLAEKIRTKSYGVPVYKKFGAFRSLKSASHVYNCLTIDAARSKNRIKAVFRSWGVETPGESVYEEEKWPEWEVQLPEHARAPAKHFLSEVCALEKLKAEAQREMLAHAKKHKIFSVLKTCPGMGPIRVAMAMAIIMEPQRFRKRQQLWSYAGLSVRTVSSSDYVKNDGRWTRVNTNHVRGLSKQHNTQLKAIFNGAAMTIIAQAPDDDPMRVHYEKQVADGKKPNLARLTIARQVASVFLKMWKTGESYDPKRLAKTTKTSV